MNFFEDHLVTESIQDLANAYARWFMQLDIDQGRLKTANNINSAQGREELIYATPETKGILLYAVTHWSSRTAPILISMSLLVSVKYSFFLHVKQQ